MSGTRITADGYLVADVRCARTGTQQYLASDLGLADGGMVTVYRSEDVVFDKASLATFAGKPVTMGHPMEAVTAANWKALAVGDIGTEIARDGEFVRVPLKVMDASAIDMVQSGGAREVSMGYTTGIEMKDGIAPDGTPYQAVQTGPIRINHLAIVPRARGGSQLRIGDDAAPWGAAPFTSDGKDIGMADTPMKTVVLGDKAVNVPVTEAPAIEAFKDAAAVASAKLVADHEKTIAAKDAELATKDAEIASLKGKVLDAAALDKLVADRAALTAKAKAIAPAVVTDGQAPAAIKRAAVEAKKGTMADKSDAYVDAMFDILAAEVGDADPLKAALADGAGQVANDRNKIYADRAATISAAWKTPKKEVA